MSTENDPTASRDSPLTTIANRIWLSLDLIGSVDEEALIVDCPDLESEIRNLVADAVRELKELEDIIFEAENACDEGEAPNIEQLVAQHPRHELRLRRFYGAKQVAQSIGPPVCFELKDTSKYQICGEPVPGGMGAIVQAHDSHFDRYAAIKVPLKNLATDPGLVARLDLEAKISGMLQHTNILPIFEKGYLESKTGEKVPFFAMPFLPGDDLEETLKKQEDSSEQQFKYVIKFRDICQAMAYAHSRNVIHRDLKPKNVMIGAHGDVYVIDWGYARLISDTPSAERGEQRVDRKPVLLPDQFEYHVTQVLTTPPTEWQGDEFVTRTIGTPEYLPPEVATQQVYDDKRLDVFGLGGILCRILTGEPTYCGAGFEVRDQIERGDLQETFDRLDACDAPRPLVHIAKACLSPDSNDRPADAGEVATLVSQFIDDTEKARFRAERRLRFAQVAIVVLVAGAVISVVVGLRQLERRARIDELTQAGNQAYFSGDHDSAVHALDSVLELENNLPSVEIKRVRALVSRRNRAGLIETCEQIQQMRLSPRERTEVRFVHGDLLSCIPGRVEEGTKLLQDALARGHLSTSDAEYAEAVLATNIRDALKHLKRSLDHDRFHHRASLLYSSLLFASGQVTEAERQAEQTRRLYPAEPIVNVIIESCRCTTNSDPQTSLDSTYYTQKLAALLESYTTPIRDNPQPGLGHLTLRRQAHVVGCVRDLISALPETDSRPGLPLQPFQRRATTLRRIERLAQKTSPPLTNYPTGAFKWALETLGWRNVDRSGMAAELEALGRNETDGLAVQLAAVAKFIMTGQSLSQADQMVAGLERISELQTLALAKETLAPRSQFELAARFVRIISDFGLLRDYGVTEIDEGRIRGDIQDIFENGHKYPKLLNDIAGLLMTLILNSTDESIGTDNADEFSLALRVVNDWVEATPESIPALLYRARIWKHLGNDDYARRYAESVLLMDNENQTENRILESLEPAE